MHKALLIVADGSKSRLFERKLPLGFLEQIHVFYDNLEDLEKDHDYHGGKPGRVFESGNTAHHAHEPRDTWRERHKKSFIEEVASFVEGIHSPYDEVYLCAPPHVLGLLRHALPKDVSFKITREYVKDLVRTPLEELGEFIDAMPH